MTAENKANVSKLCPSWVVYMKNTLYINNRIEAAVKERKLLVSELVQLTR
jgi:hypothetical protein